VNKLIGWQLMVTLSIGPFALLGVANDLAPEPAREEVEKAGLGVGVQSDGAEIYAKNCAMCHGEEGGGDGPAAAAMDPRPTDLTDAERMSALSDEALLEAISNGKGSMPGYGSMLKAEELKALAEFVRKMSAEDTDG
jgi:mono/diheme cytochrome c family protein